MDFLRGNPSKDLKGLRNSGKLGKGNYIELYVHTMIINYNFIISFQDTVKFFKKVTNFVSVHSKTQQTNKFNMKTVNEVVIYKFTIIIKSSR